MRDLYHDPKHSHHALGYLEATLSPDDVDILLETENHIESILNRCDESKVGYNDYTIDELVEFVKHVRLYGI